MMTTTDRCDSAKKSITKLLPKNVFHRDVKVITVLTLITLLRINFGEMIFLQISLELGIPESSVPASLINKWFVNDNGTDRRRLSSKKRREHVKKSRNLDNKMKTKKYGQTRRNKNGPLKF